METNKIQTATAQKHLPTGDPRYGITTPDLDDAERLVTDLLDPNSVWLYNSDSAYTAPCVLAWAL
jgi:hypothetical protein